MNGHLAGPYEHKGDGYIMAPGRSVVPFAELIDDDPKMKAATFDLLAAAPDLLAALQMVMYAYGMYETALSNSSGALQDEFIEQGKIIRAALLKASGGGE